MTTTRIEARRLLKKLYPDLRIWITSTTRVVAAPVFDPRPALAWRAIDPPLIANGNDRVAIGELLPSGIINWDWTA